MGRVGGWPHACILAALAVGAAEGAQGVPSFGHARVASVVGHGEGALRGGAGPSWGTLGVDSRREDRVDALRGGGARRAAADKGKKRDDEMNDDEPLASTPLKSSLEETLLEAKAGAPSPPRTASPRDTSPPRMQTPLKKVTTPLKGTAPSAREASPPRTQTPLKGMSKTPMRRQTTKTPFKAATPIRKSTRVETPLKSAPTQTPSRRAPSKTPVRGTTPVRTTTGTGLGDSSPPRGAPPIKLELPIKKAPPRMKTPLKCVPTAASSPPRAQSGSRGSPRNVSPPRTGQGSQQSSPFELSSPFQGGSPFKLSSPFQGGSPFKLQSPFKEGSPFRNLLGRSGSADAARRRSAPAPRWSWPKLPVLRLPKSASLSGMRKEAASFVASILVSILAWHFRSDLVRAARFVGAAVYPVAARSRSVVTYPTALFLSMLRQLVHQAAMSVKVTVLKSAIIYHFTRSLVLGTVRLVKAAARSIKALAQGTVVTLMTPRGRLGLVRLVTSSVAVAWSLFARSCSRLISGLAIFAEKIRWQVYQAIRALLRRPASFPTPLEFCSLLVQNLAMVPQTVRKVPYAVQSLLLRLISGKPIPQEAMGGFAKAALSVVGVISLYTAWSYYMVNNGGAGKALW